VPAKRPVAVVVVAVLQLVFGCLALGNDALSLAGLDKAVASAGQVNASGQQPLGLLDVENRLEERVPSYVPGKQVVAGSGIALALLMIGSGVGLLLLRPWGRPLALGYAILSILATGGYLVWFVSAVAPAVTALGREVAAAGGDQANAMGVVIPVLYIGIPILASLSVVYPIVVLIVLCRQRVRAAFGGVVEPAAPEDYRDPVPPAPDQGRDDHFQAGPP
jgi:hypothetical protein